MSGVDDQMFMQRAIELALQGQYTTAPNPNVGCVIVKNNCIVGEGYHQKAGSPHAEVHALLAAGEQAAGATAYVTLEPCAHTGKTPPCVDALIQSGIMRVVIALTDPNPKVAGKGIEKLTAAGIEVEVGVLSDEAEAVNVDFLHRMRAKRPYIQLKLAASLDGKTALASGESQWITSVPARQDVQLSRAKSDAILSTSATVLADDPKLNVRWHDLPDDIKETYSEATLRQPVRIILDGQCRLTSTEKIFKTKGPILWICKRMPEISQLPLNVSVLLDPNPSKYIDLKWLFSTLASHEINSVWVEAGPKLAGSLIKDNYVDELIVYFAPKLLGNQGKDLCCFPSPQCLLDAPQFTLIDHHSIGGDLRLRLRPITSSTRDQCKEMP